MGIDLWSKSVCYWLPQVQLMSSWPWKAILWVGLPLLYQDFSCFGWRTYAVSVSGWPLSPSIRLQRIWYSCRSPACGRYHILPLRYIWLSLNALYWNNYSSQSVCQHDIVLCRIVKPFHASSPPCDCFVVCHAFSKAARKPCDGVYVFLCNFSQQCSKTPHRGSQAVLTMFCVIERHQWCWNLTTSRRKTQLHRDPT